MSGEFRYSILENNRFSREKSYGLKRLRELFHRGEIRRDTPLWLWDGDESRLAGTYESVLIHGRQFKERRIGLYGLSGSGKTSWLDCCTRYGKRFDDGSIIISQDNAAHDDDPEPSETTEEISAVDFSLLHDGVAWEIRTFDYPGRRFEQSEPGDKLDDWFAECDALLLLIDVSQDEKEQIEAMRLFLDRQRRRSPTGNRIEKPMTVVVSKADLIGYPDPEQPLPKELRAAALEFGDVAACFPVSVRDGVHTAPHRVAEPWCWAVREVDRLRIAATPRTPDAFRELRDVWGINSGENGRRVEAELFRLQSQWNKRRNKIRFLVACVFALLLCLVAYFARDSAVKKNFIDYMATKSTIRDARRREEVKSALAEYRKSSWSPPKSVAELENFAREKIAELDAGRVETEFRSARFAVVHAETPKKIDEALETFRRETIGHGDRYVGELEELATKRRKELRFRFAWKKLKHELEQAESFARTKRLYDEFLDAFDENDFPEFADRIQEARSDLERLIVEQREGIRFLPATAYFEKINRIDEQLRAFGVGDPARAALETDRKAIADQWEPDDYRKFYRLATRARNAEDLRRAAEQAEHYLQQSARRTALRIPSRFEKNVKDWKAWFDGLKEIHVVELAVTSILVPTVVFEGTEPGAKIVFTLQVGKIKSEYTVTGWETNGEKPIRFEPNLHCRVEDAVWDEQKGTAISLTIAVPREGWRSWVWSGTKAELRIADSAYPYIEFCSPLTIPVDENVSVIVETETMAMPELPEPVLPEEAATTGRSSLHKESNK